MFKKTITTALTVGSLAVTMVAFSVPAEARGWHGHGGHRWHGGHRGFRTWAAPQAVQYSCVWRRAWRHHHRLSVRVCRPIYW